MCCCWLLLNPDSRAQRENQDLLFGFFFTTNHLFFFFANERNTTKNNKSSSAPSFHRFVIYKRTQYTHLQNGPFDAIRFSWQANYRKQGFLQTVRVFDLRVMELRVELRLSFFFVLYSTLSSLGEIEEGKSMMASSSRCLYTHTHLSCLNALRRHQNNTTVRSTRRSSKRPTCRKSSPRRPSLRPPPPRCSHRYVSFFFALLVSFYEGWF